MDIAATVNPATVHFRSLNEPEKLSVIEQNYDNDGIIWPWPVAPYHVHLVSLDSAKPEIAEVAAKVERDLESSGFELLHDDREGLAIQTKLGSSRCP